MEGRSCTQLTKTFGSKRPAVDLSLTVVLLTVVFLLKKEFGINVVAHVKMAMSDRELLSLEGLSAVFGVFWLLGKRWPVRGKE